VATHFGVADDCHVVGAEALAMAADPCTPTPY
jgi:hypothetical protein